MREDFRQLKMLYSKYRAQQLMQQLSKQEKKNMAKLRNIELKILEPFLIKERYIEELTKLSLWPEQELVDWGIKLGLNTTHFLIKGVRKSSHHRLLSQWITTQLVRGDLDHKWEFHIDDKRHIHLKEL